MQKKVVEVKNLYKSYGDVKALKGVSFDVYEGEIFGFIGPNGAGKSTTIRTLLGLLKKDSGEAKIFNHEVFLESYLINPKVSYIPGDVFLWGNLTGGEIIDYLLRLKGVTDFSNKERLIKLFSLDPSKKANSYSKGNRQKVAIIAALSHDADLFIFDEPTSGLDPLNEILFQKEVKALKERGKSIILSSHILSEVEKLADSVAIIRNGKIIEYGKIKDLKRLSTSVIKIYFNDPKDVDKQLLNNIGSTKALNELEYEIEVLDENINRSLGLLQKIKMDHLEINRPKLEELFIKYYGDENDE